MINIADLVALRDGAATKSAPASAEQDPAPAQPTIAGATYPAKRLVLENGSYKAVDHDK